jgi:hypothetical protein
MHLVSTKLHKNSLKYGMFLRMALIFLVGH